MPKMMPSRPRAVFFLEVLMAEVSSASMKD